MEDPRFLYWADRMGLLVAAEMANAYLFNEDAVARMTREWIEVVARDYNHPSIIIWTPVNESWGVPNLADRRQQAHLKALYYLTKSLDDTRLVIDNDGWEHTEVTDLFAIHDYTPHRRRIPAPLSNIAQGLPLPMYGKLYSAPGQRYNGSPDPALGIWRSRLYSAGGFAEQYLPTPGVIRAWRPVPNAALDPHARTLRSHRPHPADCRDLLHPTLRCGAGNQRPDDV